MLELVWSNFGQEITKQANRPQLRVGTSIAKENKYDQAVLVVPLKTGATVRTRIL